MKVLVMLQLNISSSDFVYSVYVCRVFTPSCASMLIKLQYKIAICYIHYGKCVYWLYSVLKLRIYSLTVYSIPFVDIDMRTLFLSAWRLLQNQIRITSRSWPSWCASAVISVPEESSKLSHNSDY